MQEVKISFYRKKCWKTHFLLEFLQPLTPYSQVSSRQFVSERRVSAAKFLQNWDKHGRITKNHEIIPKLIWGINCSLASLLRLKAHRCQCCQNKFSLAWQTLWTFLETVEQSSTYCSNWYAIFISLHKKSDAIKNNFIFGRYWSLLEPIGIKHKCSYLLFVNFSSTKWWNFVYSNCFSFFSHQLKLL